MGVGSRGGTPFGRGGLGTSGSHEIAPHHAVWTSQALPTKEKHYVEVVSSTSREGQVTPLRIIWEDGRCFDIVDVLACEKSYAHSARRLVTRYSVRVRDRTTFLFYENPRWFVEAKVPPLRV
jgi:hypothetical protein